LRAATVAVLGGHVARCADCAYTTIAYNSCRNRHCPKCQGAAARAWLAEREAELLPVPYHHVLFTLPAQIADMAYDLLFKAAAETVLTIAADPKHLGARVGITAVLHTWGSAMIHHPHVHMIVPGGGISLDGSRWVACRPRFFLPVKVLSRLFRRLLLQKLSAAHKDSFSSSASTPISPSARTSRPTWRRCASASDYRIEGPKRYKVMTLAISEFIRRFLIHVLPSGFHRIRHYGLLAGSKRAENIAGACELLAVPLLPIAAINAASTDANQPQTPKDACPCCGGRMWLGLKISPKIPIRQRRGWLMHLLCPQSSVI
jgi:Putative transposase/Transposase zinc-binding domain